MLEAEADLLGASQVEEKGENVDVDQSASKYGHLLVTGARGTTGSRENTLGLR